ncbi:type VI secretion system baseplate subunit TssF [Bartonella sp. LJL80]
MNRLFSDELEYLKVGSRQFVEQNPKLAPSMGSTNTDPDVERVTEGLAYLTSMTREKIIEEEREFTLSIIQLLWPNFLRVFPSTTMIKFAPHASHISKSKVLPKGTLLNSKPIRGARCLFRTTSDCLVYPLDIDNVVLERLKNKNQIKISFKSLLNIPIHAIGIDYLDLTIIGDTSLQQLLYLWIGRYIRDVTIVSKDGIRTVLPNGCIYPIGFKHNDAVLPQHSAAFEGHRLLQEYFVFPEKFYGYSLSGIKNYLSSIADDSFDIELSFERALPRDIRMNNENLRLYCIPAVNLFETDAEPLTVDHTKTRYRIRPMGFEPHLFEIFSVDDVRGQRPSTDGLRLTLQRQYPSFESFNHEINAQYSAEQVYYFCRPDLSKKYNGFNYDLSFILHNSDEIVPNEEVISIDITCFNREGCDELAMGAISEFYDQSINFVTAKNVTRPTKPVYPPLDGTLDWNGLSNLALNYTSLLDLESIAAILTIFDFQSLIKPAVKRAAKQRIEGILSLNTQPHTLVHRNLMIKGLKSVLKVRESAFQTEGDMFLFMSILAEFFALYTTVNSFHELEIHGIENGEVYRWPAKIR